MCNVPGEGWRGGRRSGRRVARRRRWLALAAGDAAVDGTAPRQEGPAQEGRAAGSTAEAALVGVPVLTLVRHLTLVHADWLATAVAVLGERRVEAVKTVGPALAHHVALTAQLQNDKIKCNVFFAAVMIYLLSGW